MTTIKKVLLCALILNSVSLFGQQPMTIEKQISLYHEDYHSPQDGCHLSAQETFYARNIRNTIDQNHLGIGKYTCCRHFLGSIVSYYKTTLLPQDIAAQEIKKIESYIPENSDKEAVFQRLFLKHWYVNYLVQALIKEEIKNIKKVKGSTIDKLRMPDFGLDPTGRKKMVHRQACKFFCHYNEPTQNEQIDALCIVACENSEFDRAELIALLNSNSVKDLNGFPQEILQKVITHQISLLSNK